MYVATLYTQHTVSKVCVFGVYLKRRMSCHCTPRSWLRQYDLDPLEDRGVPMA